MKSILKKTAALIAVAGCLTLAVYLSESAFRDVLGFRTLERIPASLVIESVGGESQIRGIAEPGDDPHIAPKTKTRSIYYRYLLEREETDSDGDTTWRTIRDESESSNFFLRDDTGRARVEAKAEDWRIKWSIAQKYRRESGGYRHTEWRIDPGDRVTVFGVLEPGVEPLVRFPGWGRYLPIISSFTAEEERADIAFTAILKLWGGMTALIVAMLALVYLLSVHRTLVFLSLISAGGCLLLVQYGLRSAEADVSDGFNRVIEHREKAEALIQQTFSTRMIQSRGLESPFDLKSATYNRLTDDEKSRIEAWRKSAYEVRARYLLQIDRFPEDLIALSGGRDQPPIVALPPDSPLLSGADTLEFQQTRTFVSLLWVVGLLIISILAAWFSFRSIKTKRMQENIPTSKTAGVVFGLAEVKGSLIPEDEKKTLRGPLSNKPCCWYHYVVKEKRGSGKNARWHVIEDRIGKQPFLCRDEEGEIRVFPSKAECLTMHISTEHTGNKRYTEERLEPLDDLYVLGKARLDKTRGDSLVFSHEKGSPFIIANLTEEQVMFRKALLGMGALGVSLSLIFFGALLVAGSGGQLSSLDFLLASLMAPVFMIFVMAGLMYNDLVFLRERCARNWANIQVSLKKRADLIPQIEEVVKQYLSHESELQELLASMRERRAMSSDSASVDDYLTIEHAAISGINARVEAYPDLEGIDLIAVFNRRLIKLENEVSLIRSGFNDAVTTYNIRRQRFPDLLLANLFNFGELTLLAFSEDAHRVPPVVALGSR